MKKVTKYYKRLQIRSIKIAVLAVIASIFFMPSYVKIENTGDNMFTVFLNGTEVGKVGDGKTAQTCLSEARKIMAGDGEELVLIECDMELQGKEVLWGHIDNEGAIIANMKNVLENNIKKTLHRSYTVKINEYTVNLSSKDEVLQLLQASIDKYDEQGQYYADLALDCTRELNVLTANIISREEKQEEEAEKEVFASIGIYEALDEMFDAVEPAREKDFSDYELGLISLEFGDDIEIVESYLAEDKLTSLAAAIEEVTKDQEKNQIYEVVSGDTLSKIAAENNLTIEKLIEMNDTIESETSTIRVEDEIIVTVPEPELSVERVEEVYYEEDYEADIVYVDNDNWYTTETKTLQEPSAGHRKVVAIVSYRNNAETSREIVKEEVTYQAVPKIVERGTKIPPTYIKPLSGGRLSSGFGARSRPTRGASTYHKGVDWATPVGTAVMASSAGTVAKAGWGSGYGYVVYINHGDGRQTRYGHLSKVLVSAGQSVSQGQKIALSGNTGISSGPHVHFEILINGSQVNPLKYLN
ncbi:M23 family metallopeptidase [Kineothrix sp. MB12-C1]|uniref:M23 family metallopeptidase n=1 Tax=Kineothrix sp. MB12-C1 TaxID=3070215 RepID=UPI0027D2FF3E|nr:M23 family metallopeptidase [Kineothrix sp. MB12-C1]WMC93958.1 M23 family metallopeptidase [Kineothrix sp. MB12-C1]